MSASLEREFSLEFRIRQGEEKRGGQVNNPIFQQQLLVLDSAITLIESTPDAGTGALIRQDPLLMPDPEPLFSKCYKVPRAGKDRSSVTDKSNPIPKPTALGLQPQLALDMT